MMSNLSLQRTCASSAGWSAEFQRRTLQSMRLPIAFFFSVAMCCSLAGCCAFVPCHPETSLFGVVRDTNGQPVAHATVTLYGTTSKTDLKGCFNMHEADALPLTFSVAAKGYKSAQVTIELIPNSHLLSHRSKPN